MSSVLFSQEDDINDIFPGFFFHRGSCYSVFYSLVLMCAFISSCYSPFRHVFVRESLLPTGHQTPCRKSHHQGLPPHGDVLCLVNGKKRKNPMSDYFLTLDIFGYLFITMYILWHKIVKLFIVSLKVLSATKKAVH